MTYIIISRYYDDVRDVISTEFVSRFIIKFIVFSHILCSTISLYYRFESENGSRVYSKSASFSRPLFFTYVGKLYLVFLRASTETFGDVLFPPPYLPNPPKFSVIVSVPSHKRGREGELRSRARVFLFVESEIRVIGSVELNGRLSE